MLYAQRTILSKLKFNSLFISVLVNRASIFVLFENTLYIFLSYISSEKTLYPDNYV